MLIVDAGPLYAAAASSDNYHAVCEELLANATGPLVVPQLVVSEVAYLLGDRVSAQAEIVFGQSIADGLPAVEPVLESEWSRITELMEQYADLPLGMADASVVVLAERLGLAQIATLDRRHFSVVRPRHVESFTLLPGHR